jgi:ATP-dependent RNA helicase SUPV3L1/SUV3
MGSNLAGVSCRRSEVTVAIDGEAMSIDEAPPEAPPPHDLDFSNVQGLQVAGAQSGAAGDAAAEDAWRAALKLELEARAARFHQAVDASIVLSDDGVIRWLGDPVARLAAGPDLLSPRALVLADPILPDGARDMVAARLELWLAATIRRLLGPLLALRSLEEGSESVRQLATRVADSLGVLEREPLKSQIKALDQNSRAALRRHGVRFGAYYVYVPLSLKPAARSLALRLWSLRAPDATGEELAKTLLPLASSGRTSLPVSPSISKDSYRVAGFRPCGERAVRVDIVERLADMIRAAFVACAPSERAPSPGSGFLVTGQMTSLTGCSGETFASILRSLGYESFEIEASRFAPPRPQPAPPVDASVATPSDAAPVAAPHSESETADAAPVEGSPAAVGEPPADGEKPKAEEEEAVQGSAPEMEEPPNVEADPLVAAIADNAAAPGCHPTAPAPAPQTTEAAGAGTEGATAEPRVTAWRFARKPRPERSKRGVHHSQARCGSLRQPKEAESKVEQDQERRPGGPGRDADGKGAAHRKRERLHRADEQRRKPSLPNPQNEAPAFASRRAPPLDPNSPFAKLLELRSALEKQGKNR